MGRLDLQPLDRLRRRLTAWNVLTFGTILLAIGTALFFVVAHEIGVTLDRSLDGATGAVMHAVGRAEAAAASGQGSVSAASLRRSATDAMRRLEIPDRSLYLFDAGGQSVYPESASVWVRSTVAHALGREGHAEIEASIGHEHTLRVHARRFTLPSDDALIAVAAADTEELEDEYTAVLELFGIAALVAVALVAAGGVFLVHKSTAPVTHSFEQMQRFMADASHELRTPVAVLRAQADVALERRRTRDAYREALEEIRQEAETLSGIVDDLLTLARAEAGAQSVRHDRLYLDDVALDAATAARAMAEQRAVQLDVTEYEEAAIPGDQALVRRLLMIVLDNAIKYTRPGGRVLVGVSAAGASATVFIADTGTGIAPEVLPHIFERFYRADTVPPRAGGAGLGLAIARWIADEHGASIAIASPPGQGTRVTLRFPRVP